MTFGGVETYEEAVREHDRILHDFIVKNISLIPDFTRGISGRWDSIPTESKWASIYTELSAIPEDSSSIKFLNTKTAKIPRYLTKEEAKEFIASFPMTTWIYLLQTTESNMSAIRFLLFADAWKFIRDVIELVAESDRKELLKKIWPRKLTPKLVYNIDSIEMAKLISEHYTDPKFVSDALKNENINELDDNRGLLLYYAVTSTASLKEWSDLLRIQGSFDSDLFDYLIETKQSEISSLSIDERYHLFMMAIFMDNLFVTEKLLPYIKQEDFELTLIPQSAEIIKLLYEKLHYEGFWRTSWWVDWIKYHGINKDTLAYIIDHNLFNNTTIFDIVIGNIISEYDGVESLQYLRMIFDNDRVQSMLRKTKQHPVIPTKRILKSNNSDEENKNIVNILIENGFKLYTLEYISSYMALNPLTSLAILDAELPHYPSRNNDAIDMLITAIKYNMIDIAEKVIIKNIIEYKDAENIIEKLNKRTKLYKRLTAALKQVRK